MKRVPPILIVGPGARDYASVYNFPMIPNEHLVSVSAHQRWLKWKRELDNHRTVTPTSSRSRFRSGSRQRHGSSSAGTPSPGHRTPTDGAQEEEWPRAEDHITDTVGAICVDRWGRVAAGSSSGGIGMKFRGRIGPAALIGVGTQIRVHDDGTVVAATCSGEP